MTFTRRARIPPGARAMSCSRSSSTWRARHELQPFVAAFLLIKRWIERTRQRRALGGLDEPMLRDIGITRVEASRECEKPFWR
jgi:uncharacterized protein YjiS (DUF1127 family)